MSFTRNTRACRSGPSYPTRSANRLNNSLDAPRARESYETQADSESGRSRASQSESEEAILTDKRIPRPSSPCYDNFHIPGNCNIHESLSKALGRSRPGHESLGSGQRVRGARRILKQTNAEPLQTTSSSSSGRRLACLQESTEEQAEFAIEVPALEQSKQRGLQPQTQQQPSKSGMPHNTPWWTYVLHTVTVIISLAAIIVATLVASGYIQPIQRTLDDFQEMRTGRRRPITERVASLETGVREQKRSLRKIFASDSELHTRGWLESFSVTYIRWGRRSCPGSSEEITWVPRQNIPGGLHFPPQPQPQPRLGIMPGIPAHPGLNTPLHRGAGFDGRVDDFSNVQLVYVGLTAGSLSTQTGNGVNPLCLPLNPTWGNFSDAAHHGGAIYGAEYRIGMIEGTYNVFRDTDNPVMNRRRVPCAVCQVRRSTAMLMVPGSVRCPGNWNAQYIGYLMSEKFDSHKSQYICVDVRAEDGGAFSPGIPGESLGLYPVEAQCGSLPCGVYVSGREVACVVCTR